MAVDADRELRRMSRAEIGSLREQFECELFLGNEDKALELAEYALRHKAACDPADADHIRSHILVPLQRRGRLDEVRKFQNRCAEQLNPERCYYWLYGEVIKSFALTGHIARAAATMSAVSAPSASSLTRSPGSISLSTRACSSTGS
jgi:hypothetical protein